MSRPTHKLAAAVLAAAILAVANPSARADGPATMPTVSIEQTLPIGTEQMLGPNMLNGVKPRTVIITAEVMSQETGPRKIQLVRELGAGGRPQAIVPLRQAMADADPLVRAEAARAAAVLGSDELRDDVRKLLKDGEPRVRREAVLATARLGDASAVDGALADADLSVFLAGCRAASTAAHARQIAAKLAALDPSAQAAALDGIAQTGDTAQAATVAGLAGASVPVRARAIAALGAIHATAQLPVVLKALGDEHPSVRREALLALLGVADAAGQNTQAKLKLADPDRAVRAAAAQVLSKSPSPEAVALLVAQLGEDYAPLHREAREAIIAAGRDAASKQAAIAASVQLMSDPAARRREDGSYVLGQVKSDAGLPRHIELLADSDWLTVGQAARSLGLIGRKEAAAPMAVLVKRALGSIGYTADKIDSTRACADAIIAAGQLGAESILDDTNSRMGDKKTPLVVRTASIWAWGVLGLPTDKHHGGAKGRVMKFYGDDEEDEAVKFEGIKALGNMKAPDAVEDLRSREPKEPGAAMRFALHWSADRIEGKLTPYAAPDSVHAAYMSIIDKPVSPR